MGALPKQRISHARQGERRAHMQLTPPVPIVCPHCKKPQLSHHACLHCGMYRGRQVFLPKTKKK